MKSKLSSDSAMRNPAGQPANAGTGYAPSVPISVYRELAAELQATKTLLDSLNAQNQQLTHQNQQLRQAIDRVVQSAVNLQQMAESGQPAASQHPEMAEPMRVSRPASRQARAVAGNPVRSGAELPTEPSPDVLFTEESGQRPQVRSKPAPPKEFGGLWLVLILTAIVISAFGAGFLVVRPLLPSSR